MSTIKVIGTKLKHVNDSAFEVAGITKLTPPDSKRDKVDVTTFDSVGGVKEYEASPIDNGEFTVEGFIKDMDNFLDMETLYKAGEVETWQIELVDGTLLDFDGYVSKWSIGDLDVNGRVLFSGAIQTSGDIVTTSGVESV